MNDVNRTTDADSVRPDHLQSRRLRSSRAVSLLLVVVCLAVLGGLGWYLSHRNATREPAGGCGGRGRPTATVAFAVAQPRGHSDSRGSARHGDADGHGDRAAAGVGRVQEIYYQEGQTVQRGQPLVQIDPRPFRARARTGDRATRARRGGARQRARDPRAQSRPCWRRTRSRKQDVDTQAATVKQLLGTVAADRAAVGTARLNLELQQSGRADQRARRVASGGCRQLRVDGDADRRRDASRRWRRSMWRSPCPRTRCRPCRSVSARARACPQRCSTERAPARSATGTFLTLDNQIDTQTGTVRAKARFENADRPAVPEPVRERAAAVGHVEAGRSSCRRPPFATVRKGDFVYVIAQDRHCARSRR